MSRRWRLRHGEALGSGLQPSVGVVAARRERSAVGMDGIAASRDAARAVDGRGGGIDGVGKKSVAILCVGATRLVEDGLVVLGYGREQEMIS